MQRLKQVGSSLVFGMLVCSSTLHAHGLVEEPASRNWICGAITKPDHIGNGTAQYPICGQAFGATGVDPNAGYNFMSVLTHTTGRAGVGPRTNVCSFNSETWSGRATPWDQPIDWPTHPMSAGPRTFTWNISWGPHFSDTADFKYWITKPDFQYQVGRPLSFSDFEEAPFCSLNYDDTQPNANPNIVADPANARFRTQCNVPQRSGRHVIYAEWGRNQWTYERFHGCIDAKFDGGTVPTVTANIALQPNVTTFEGAGTLSLDARGSTGSNLAYRWSVDAANPSLYTLANATQPVTTLTLSEPQAASEVTIRLVVTSGGTSATASRSLTHRPASTSTPWFDLGPLTDGARTLNVGDRVSIRTVSASGQDAYWPQTGLAITAQTAAATAWPLALAQTVNASNGIVRVGVLNSQNQIVPSASATANRVYASDSTQIANAYLHVVPAPTDSGVVTLSSAVTSASPWFNEQQVRLANTASLTALDLTVVVQKTAGLAHSGFYNTVGGQIQQSYSETASAITYRFQLAPGQTLSAGSGRTFAVQTRANGTSHATSADTYSVTYTSGGVTQTRSGTF